jgi:hypothetical protein
MADFPASRPFYRSRLFLLGLPGLAFLLWAWLADPFSSVSLDRGTSRVTVSSGRRQVRIVTYTSAGPITVAGHTGTASHRPSPAPLFPPAVKRTVLVDSVSDMRITYLSIASWLLLLVYLGAWAALLTGWQRRKARLMKASSAPLPP